MTRKLPLVDALAPGRYVATVKRKPIGIDEPTASVLDAIPPATICVSDGKWCTFFLDGVEVWSCNAHYAAAHFGTTPAQRDRAQHEGGACSRGSCVCNEPAAVLRDDGR